MFLANSVANGVSYAVSHVAAHAIIDSIRTPGHTVTTSSSVSAGGRVGGYGGNNYHASSTSTSVSYTTRPTYHMPSFMKMKKAPKGFSPVEKPFGCNPSATFRGNVVYHYEAQVWGDLSVVPGESGWIEIHYGDKYKLYRDRDGSVGMVPKCALNVGLPVGHPASNDGYIKAFRPNQQMAIEAKPKKAGFIAKMKAKMHKRKERKTQKAIQAFLNNY